VKQEWLQQSAQSSVCADAPEFRQHWALWHDRSGQQSAPVAQPAPVPGQMFTVAVALP
jgi:hypothetical protein